MRTIMTIFILTLIAAVAPHTPRANPASAQSVFACAYNTSTNGLISWWKLEADTDSVAVDQMGNNDGTWTNGASSTDAAGFVGNGGDFDGTNDYIDCGKAASMDFVNDFTVSMWVDIDNLSDRMCPLVRGSYQEDGWYCTSETGGDFRIWVNRSGYGQRNFATWDVLKADGKFQHVVCGYDDGVLFVYVDGESAGDPDSSDYGFSGDFLYNSDRDMVIGHTSDIRLPFNGQIDEVRIYDRALSAHEIRRLYLQGHSQSDEVNE